MRHRAFLLLFILMPALTADSAVILFQRTQEAIDTPFEPLRNPGFGGDPSPLTSEDAQNAIEEVFFNSPGNAARTAVTFGSAGNTNNKFLEFFRSVSSNTTPHVFPDDATVTDISCATSTSSTNDFEILINGVVEYTLNKTGLTQIGAGIDEVVLPADTLSLKIVNGAGKDPVCTVFYQVIL